MKDEVARLGIVDEHARLRRSHMRQDTRTRLIHAGRMESRKGDRGGIHVVAYIQRIGVASPSNKKCKYDT